VREFAADELLRALGVDFPVTEPTFLQPPDLDHTVLPTYQPMVNRRNPAKVALRIAFSRNQNAVDAGPEVSNSSPCLETEDRGEPFSVAYTRCSSIKPFSMLRSF
jgi:hypothetical protein